MLRATARSAVDNRIEIQSQPERRAAFLSDVAGVGIDCYNVTRPSFDIQFDLGNSDLEIVRIGFDFNRHIRTQGPKLVDLIGGNGIDTGSTYP